MGKLLSVYPDYDNCTHHHRNKHNLVGKGHRRHYFRYGYIHASAAEASKFVG
jgi:hypothetical protein